LVIEGANWGLRAEEGRIYLQPGIGIYRDHPNVVLLDLDLPTQLDISGFKPALSLLGLYSPNNQHEVARFQCALQKQSLLLVLEASCPGAATTRLKPGDGSGR